MAALDVDDGLALLGPSATAAGRDLGRVHLPTGRISREEVLRLAIMELGVRQRRPDWASVLQGQPGDRRAVVDLVRLNVTPRSIGSHHSAATGPLETGCRCRCLSQTNHQAETEPREILR